MPKVKKGLVNPVLATIRQPSPPATRYAVPHSQQSYPQSIQGMSGQGYNRNSQKLRQLQEDATTVAVGGRPYPDDNSRRFYGLFGRDAVNEPQKAMTMAQRQQREINQSLRTGNGNRRIQKASYGNAFVGDVKGVLVQPKKGRPFKGQSDSLSLVSKRGTKKKSSNTVRKAIKNPFAPPAYGSPYADIYAEQATGKKPRNANALRNQYQQQQVALLGSSDPKALEEYRNSILTGVAPFGFGSVAGIGAKILPKAAQVASRVAPRVAAAATRFSPKIGAQIAAALEARGVQGAANAANNQFLNQMLNAGAKSATAGARTASSTAGTGARAAGAARSAARNAAQAGSRAWQSFMANAKPAMQSAAQSARNAAGPAGEYLRQAPGRAGRAFYNYTTRGMRGQLQNWRDIANLPFGREKVLRTGWEVLKSPFSIPAMIQGVVDVPVQAGYMIHDAIKSRQNTKNYDQWNINPEYANNPPANYQRPVIANDVRYDSPIETSGKQKVAPTQFFNSTQRIALRERLNEITNNYQRPLTAQEFQGVIQQIAPNIAQFPLEVQEELIYNSHPLPANPNERRYSELTNQTVGLRDKDFASDYRYYSPSSMQVPGYGRIFEDITFDDLTPEQQAEYILRGKPIEYPMLPNAVETAMTNIPKYSDDMVQLAGMYALDRLRPEQRTLRAVANMAADPTIQQYMSQFGEPGVAMLAGLTGTPAYKFSDSVGAALAYNRELPSAFQPEFKPGTENAFPMLPSQVGQYLTSQSVTRNQDRLLQDSPASYVVGFAKNPSQSGYYTNPAYPSLQELNAKEQSAVQYAKEYFKSQGIQASDTEINQFIQDLKSLSGFNNPLRVATIRRVGDTDPKNLVPYSLRSNNAQVYNPNTTEDPYSAFMTALYNAPYMGWQDTMQDVKDAFSASAKEEYLPYNDIDWFVGSQVPENEYYADYRAAPLPKNWVEAVGITPEENQGNLNWLQSMSFGKRATPKKKSVKKSLPPDNTIIQKRIAPISDKPTARPLPKNATMKYHKSAAHSSEYFAKQASALSKYDTTQKTKNKYLKG